jgi:hypothetical protein
MLKSITRLHNGKRKLGEKKGVNFVTDPREIGSAAGHQLFKRTLPINQIMVWAHTGLQFIRPQKK